MLAILAYLRTLLRLKYKKNPKKNKKKGEITTFEKILLKFVIISTILVQLKVLNNNISRSFAIKEYTV